MEDNERRPDSEEIRTIRPQQVELIDPRESEERAARRRRQPGQIRSRVRLASFLFLATCISTYLVGGLNYAIPLMLTLIFHEMGHYLQARRYGVPASLPYFIPMPITPFGTMGAVIVQGAGVADRKQLFDIAITGPLAGLVLALPFTWWGLQHAEIRAVNPAASGLAFGEPLILQWMIEYIHGPREAGEDVMLNPMLFAGWVGIFITALNLIPIGQLDGGHILYTLLGKRSHWVATLLLWGAVAAMIYTSYYAWILMVFLLLLMGPRHPPTADDEAPLGRGRVILGWLTLSFIVIGFTPMPLVEPGAEKKQEQQQEEEKEEAPAPLNPEDDMVVEHSPAVFRSDGVHRSGPASGAALRAEGSAFPAHFHKVEGVGGELLFCRIHASPDFSGGGQLG